MNLTDASLDDLKREIFKRSTECILVIKTFDSQAPIYYWKGYQAYCLALCNELSNILSPEEDEDAESEL